MSIFKKIVSMLFEETESEVLVDDEIEPVEFKKSVPSEKESFSSAAKEDDFVAYSRPSYVKTPEREVQPQADVVADKTKEQKKFVSINIDEKQAQKQFEKEERATRSTLLRKEEKKEFDFSPVISPIFGKKEEVVKTETKKDKSVPVSKVKKKNPLGTVISPYYGLQQLEAFEDEAKEIMEAKEVSKRTASTTILNPIEQEKQMSEEEKQSLPLDDILSMNEVVLEDDLVQFSLFGEAIPVSEDEGASYRLKE